MRTRYRVIMSLALLVVAIAAHPRAARAELLSWSATPLTGDQEVPPNVTPATGAAGGSLDTVTGELSWTVTHADFPSNVTAIVFHGPALPGVDATAKLPVHPISGLASPSIGSAIIPAGDVTQILDGLWYINIHSNDFFLGEIRGQVEIVSATGVPSLPGWWSGVLAAALVVLAGTARVQLPRWRSSRS